MVAVFASIGLGFLIRDAVLLPLLVFIFGVYVASLAYVSLVLLIGASVLNVALARLPPGHVFVEGSTGEQAKRR